MRTSRTTSVSGAPATPSAINNRIELVPQSIAATLRAPISAFTPRPRARTAPPAAPAPWVGGRPRLSRPGGFGPGPSRQAVRDEHVQALNPLRHAAGADA